MIFFTAVAEPIQARSTDHGEHYQIRMGDGSVNLTITPAIAKQWLPIIEEIAKES